MNNKTRQISTKNMWFFSKNVTFDNVNIKVYNYIIIYNDFTVEKVSCKVNNYKRYLILEFLDEMMRNSLEH